MRNNDIIIHVLSESGVVEVKAYDSFSFHGAEFFVVRFNGRVLLVLGRKGVAIDFAVFGGIISILSLRIATTAYKKILSRYSRVDIDALVSFVRESVTSYERKKILTGENPGWN